MIRRLLRVAKPLFRAMPFAAVGLVASSCGTLHNAEQAKAEVLDRKSTRLNSSHPD